MNPIKIYLCTKCLNKFAIIYVSKNILWFPCYYLAMSRKSHLSQTNNYKDFKVNGVNLNVKYTRDIVLQCRVGNENFTECIVCQLTLL